MRATDREKKCTIHQEKQKCIPTVREAPQLAIVDQGEHVRGTRHRTSVGRKNELAAQPPASNDGTTCLTFLLVRADKRARYEPNGRVQYMYQELTSSALLAEPLLTAVNCPAQQDERGPYEVK